MRSTAEEARARVLAAARHEFSLHGFAGGRIDRISEEANVSKERLYSYFGNKQGLWLALMVEEIGRLDAIGSVDSLDGSAIVGRLFDAFVHDSELLRLFYWQLLEAAESWPGDDRADLDASKVANVTGALRGGTARSPLHPEVIVRLMISTAANGASVYLAGRQTPPRLAVIRDSVVHVGGQLLATADPLVSTGADGN